MRTPTPLPAPPADARERAIRLLTDRYADGTLDETGFESQLARLTAAPDVPALEALAHDLEHARPPAVPYPPSAAAIARPPAGAVLPAAPMDGSIRAVFGEARRRGWWAVPRYLEVNAVFGAVKLDLREASLPDLVEVTVEAYLAEVVLVVPPGVTVDFQVSPILGNAVCRVPASLRMPGVPHLRVTGTSVLAEVKVVERAREG